ncbi:MAG TPA: POTRA domain-containing protein [Candidatus Saccharimonadales bacterium]|jgi:outer membrane protein assembly factor BamA|nr:POTRA domain-containing protein [Candidatus Saccharimonadales bacterium]
MPGYWVAVAGIGVALAGAAPLRAQREPLQRQLAAAFTTVAVETAERATVREIRFAGLRRISPETLREQIVSHAGEPLDAVKIERDVRTLARTGWFETVRADLESAVIPPENSLESGPAVRLTFYVPELPFLTGVEYRGSRLLSRAQIEKLLAENRLTPKLGDPANPLELDRARKLIESTLAGFGHPRAHVRIAMEESTQATTVARFEINDRAHLPVGRISLLGSPAVPQTVLNRQMRLSPDALFAGLRGKNVYTPGTFAEDRQRLLTYYQNHGYPEARVGTEEIYDYESFSRRWLPWTHKTARMNLAVTIPVEAGALYRIGSVTTSETLAQAARIGPPKHAQQGKSAAAQVYSAQSVENWRRAWEARVRSQRKSESPAQLSHVEAIRILDAAAHSARITMDLSSAPPYTVRRLEFRGIRHFPDRYFRKRIGLTEGAPFDDKALEGGLARLARTGYFKPIKREQIHIAANDSDRTVDVVIQIEELGKQRGSLVGGTGQFGSTLGIAYTLFNFFDREEMLSSKIEGGPESLQLALGFAKEGFLGSRGSLALSLFNTFLLPRLSGTVKGPFFRQRSEGVSADYNYTLTPRDALTATYGLSYSGTSYSPAALAGLNGATAADIHARSFSRSIGLGWTRNTGSEQFVLADSISGGWLGGSENLMRLKADYERIFRDRVFKSQNAWAFRTTLAGVGSYSGNMPPTARLYSEDEFVRGLRNGELGAQALIPSAASSTTTRYSTTPAGANLIAAENTEYRIRLGANTEGAGFFDLGSGLLQPGWLGRWRPAVIDSTNGLVHGSAGVELHWTPPEVGLPIRAYYAWNVLRLDRSILLPNGSLFHIRNRMSAFGWGFGSFF